MQRGILSLCALISASFLCAGLLAVTPSLARSGIDQLSGELDNASRNICRTLELGNCNWRSPARQKSRAAATKPRPPKQSNTAKALAIAPQRNIVPLPRQKPLQVAAAESVNQPQVEPSEPAAPLPRSKPATQTAMLTPAAPVLKEKVTETPPAPKDAAAVPPMNAAPQISPLADCMAKLKIAGAEFMMAPTPASTGECMVTNPVRLVSVSTPQGEVMMTDQPVLNCRFALEFTRWISESASPIIASRTGFNMKSISTGPGYECRGRNGDTSAKLSEHAFGNAVDITTIATTDGRTIDIAQAADPSSKDFTALRSLRTTACGYFTTVLGPGANDAHNAHFHFDLGMHGKTDRYRICQ
jgi:hypothetical protein